MGGDKVKALCVATRCTTLEQFISTFCRYCDQDSFFVATLAMRPAGLETPFSIQLVNRTPVLRGTCVVLETWSTGENPFKRPGIRLGIRRLTPDSEPVFAQLQGARAAAPLVPITDAASAPAEAPGPLPAPMIPRPQPPMVPRAATSKNVVAKRTGAVMIPPKDEVNEVNVIGVVLPEAGPTKENPLFKAEVQRTPGSELILPANPLMNLTDGMLEGFIDCTLYEETATFFPSGELSFGIEEPKEILPVNPTVGALAATPTFRPKRVTMQPPVIRGVEVHSEQSQSNILRIDGSGMLRLDPEPPALRVDQSGLLRADPIAPAPRPQSQSIEIHTEQSGILRIDQSGMLRVDGVETTGVVRVDQSGMLRLEPPGVLPPGPIADPGGLLAEPATSQLHVDMAGNLRVEPTGQMPPIPRTRGLTGPVRVPPTSEIPRFLSDDQMRTPVPVGEQFTEPVRMHPFFGKTVAISGILNRRTLVIGGAALMTLLIVIIAVVASGGGETHAATNPPPPPTVAVTKPAPVNKLEAPPPKPEPQVKAVDVPGSATDPGADGVVGEGPCKLDVKTTPAGSMVAIDGRVVGPSPITIGGPCDRHKIDLSHPRYKSETRSVALTQDQPAELDVTLVRPTHNVKILSSPPGADVFIGGRPAGSTPTMVQLMGFSGIEVKIARTGFKTVTTRFYSKTAEDKFYVSLDPQRVKPK